MRALLGSELDFCRDADRAVGGCFGTQAAEDAATVVECHFPIIQFVLYSERTRGTNESSRQTICRSLEIDHGSTTQVGDKRHWAGRVIARDDTCCKSLIQDLEHKIGSSIPGSSTESWGLVFRIMCCGRSGSTNGNPERCFPARSVEGRTTRFLQVFGPS